MGDDQTFRIIRALGIAAVLPFGIYLRLRSQATGEKLDRRQEGLFILLTLRPIILVGMIGLLTFVASPARMAWSSVSLPVLLRWASVGIGLLTNSLLAWTYRTLGTNITNTVVIRRHHTLVTTGPYRLVRHPCLCGVRSGLPCQRSGHGELVHRAHREARDDPSTSCERRPRRSTSSDASAITTCDTWSRPAGSSRDWRPRRQLRSRTCTHTGSL